MRRVRLGILTLALGITTAIGVAWAFAMWAKVPMYPRGKQWAIVKYDRPWQVVDASFTGGVDRWWLDVNADDPGVPAAQAIQKMVAEHARISNGAAAYSSDPLQWGSLTSSAGPPPDIVIGADTAFGWPWPCMWDQVRGKLNGNTTTASELHGAIHIRGAVDTRGRDFQALPLRPIWSTFLANTLLYAAAWFAILWLPAVLRRKRRRHRGACLACGYDLRGKIETGCPECGWNRPVLSS